jgi:putative endonuclease
MSTHNRDVGKQGEQVAAEFLEGYGHRILTRNARTPYGEIDLVTEKEGITVFVEVKTRTSASLGPPEMAVTTRKQANMLAAAEHYAQEHALQHWQIDVVAVRLHTGMKPEITHFERAIG